MSNRSLVHLVNRHGRNCHYCGCELMIPDGQGRMPQDATWDEFKWRRASREHLQKRCEGGTKSAQNLVLACVWCNSNRHDHPPEIWAIVVVAMKRVRRHPCFGGAITTRRSRPGRRMRFLRKHVAVDPYPWGQTL